MGLWLTGVKLEKLVNGRLKELNLQLAGSHFCISTEIAMFPQFRILTLRIILRVINLPLDSIRHIYNLIFTYKIFHIGIINISFYVRIKYNNRRDQKFGYVWDETKESSH